MKFSDIPLRERNRSKTKLAIYKACMDLLGEKYLSQINVEELCEMVEISRGKFFSHFPRKVDIIIYAIRIWSIEYGWQTAQTPYEELGIEYINNSFQWAAQNMLEHPIFWTELMALRVFDPETINRLNQNEISILTKEDKLLMYPDKPGIEEIPEGTIVTVFRQNLQIAVEKHELPQEVDIDAILVSLTSILYGVPLMVRGYKDYGKLPQGFEKQLNILWAGLRSVYADK